MIDSIEDNTESPADPQEESTNKYKCGCSQVKGKSKTSTEGTCWDDNNYSNTPKKMD